MRRRDRIRVKALPNGTPRMAALYAEVAPGACVVCEKALKGRERRAHVECRKEWHAIYDAGRTRTDPVRSAWRRVEILLERACRRIDRANRTLERATP